jgi:hypothetical protein
VCEPPRYASVGEEQSVATPQGSHTLQSLQEPILLAAFSRLRPGGGWACGLQRSKRRQKERNLKDKGSLRPSLAARLGPKSSIADAAAADMDTPLTPASKWANVVSQ